MFASFIKKLFAQHSAGNAYIELILKIKFSSKKIYKYYLKFTIYHVIKVNLITDIQIFIYRYAGKF
ncbi:hypothetical protein D5R40_27680 [Okeania hirsuta]|uniref:Uncharacterized protein n=1 Tax=Okeania hirsuta TaxID=1458930 RepID=A0A3N6P9V6_9CYAN|nr:hypothetical protein D4Z78_02470 [Okeania hirsuta]RQH27442.1 hypothetical protein D5R40_27680 [Okeania hirsuta]